MAENSLNHLKQTILKLQREKDMFQDDISREKEETTRL